MIIIIYQTNYTKDSQLFNLGSYPLLCYCMRSHTLLSLDFDVECWININKTSTFPCSVAFKNVHASLKF